MTDTLTALLLQLSEGGRPALLWGRQAKPHFGPNFDRMLAAGVLVECPPVEQWSACTDCDCGFGIRPIQRIDGRIVAACPIDAASDTELEEDDLREFRIDPERLVQMIAGASGFPQPVAAVAPDLWRIGRLRPVRHGRRHRPRSRPSGVVLMLKTAAGGAPVTVVAPDPSSAIRLRCLEAGIDLVELRAALMASDRGIDVLDLTMLEPTAAGPRLVIERRARQVTLDGRRIHLSDQVFALLMFLAERALDSPATVEIRTIEDHIWGAGIHRIASSIREPIRALREALAAGAPDKAAVRNLIEYMRNPNGYRLRIDAGDIVISD